jgi:hypothetical protein
MWLACAGTHEDVHGKEELALRKTYLTREEEPFERLPSERVQLLRIFGNTVAN